MRHEEWTPVTKPRGSLSKHRVQRRMFPPGRWCPSHDLGDLRPDTTLRAQLRSAKAADASGECMKDGEMTNMIHISMVFISIDVRSVESIIYISWYIMILMYYRISIDVNFQAKISIILMLYIWFQHLVQCVLIWADYKCFCMQTFSSSRFADSPCNQPGDGILILTAYSENYAPGAVCEAANRAKLGRRRYLYIVDIWCRHSYSPVAALRILEVCI